MSRAVCVWLQNKAGHSVPNAMRAAPVRWQNQARSRALDVRHHASDTAHQLAQAALLRLYYQPQQGSGCCVNHIERAHRRSEIAFSAAAISTLKRQFTPVISAAVPSTWAAPPISFMISMAFDGLISSPPPSKLMPLPPQSQGQRRPIAVLSCAGRSPRPDQQYAGRAHNFPTPLR